MVALERQPCSIGTPPFSLSPLFGRNQYTTDRGFWELSILHIGIACIDIPRIDWMLWRIFPHSFFDSIRKICHPMSFFCAGQTTSAEYTQAYRRGLLLYGFCSRRRSFTLFPKTLTALPKRLFGTAASDNRPSGSAVRHPIRMLLTMSITPLMSFPPDRRQGPAALPADAPC